MCRTLFNVPQKSSPESVLLSGHLAGIDLSYLISNVALLETPILPQRCDVAVVVVKRVVIEEVVDCAVM